MAQLDQAPHSWLRTSLYIDTTFILAGVFVRCCYVPFQGLHPSAGLCLEGDDGTFSRVTHDFLMWLTDTVQPSFSKFGGPDRYSTDQYNPQCIVTQSTKDTTFAEFL